MIFGVRGRPVAGGSPGRVTVALENRIGNHMN
jgi:hypothetical protein